MSIRSATAPRTVLMAAIGFALAACDVNPYDATQQPRVSVAASATPVITWQPEGAQLVRVYRGTTAGDGYTSALVWSIAATSSNSLRSGVSYGASAPTGGTIDVPATALVPGAVYTVQVTRRDPEASGDGFTNTANRYVGTATFAAPAAPSAPALRLPPLQLASAVVR
ncbi:MAG: hypothetical protein IT353_12185 [Gemmatimonadaceae bacterium]|nr:hypothetical protein [Gemmatimonadaceae bacterium]